MRDEHLEALAVFGSKVGQGPVPRYTAPRLKTTRKAKVDAQHLIAARQQQLAVPLDNLAYTRKLLATRVLKLIQRYYDSYRVFKITDTDPMTGKEVESVLEINKFDEATGTYLNDITVGTYDVVISEQPMHVTFENSQFEQALEMRKEGVRIPDATVIRYSNLADKHDILANMQPEPADPTLEAKAKSIEAQARKAVGHDGRRRRRGDRHARAVQPPAHPVPQPLAPLRGRRHRPPRRTRCPHRARCQPRAGATRAGRWARGTAAPWSKRGWTSGTRR